jgi:hypothetical protein
VISSLDAILPPERAAISVTITLVAISGFCGGDSGGNFDIASRMASAKSKFDEYPVAWWLMLSAPHGSGEMILGVVERLL